MQSFSDHRKGMADVEEGNEAACGGVYSIILDLIKERKYAKFVNKNGRYVIDWCRAVDCYLEYIAKKDPEKFKSNKIDRTKANNKLLAALINHYKEEGAMQYLEVRKLNEKGEVVERQLQMPKRFESFYGRVQVTDDSEGDEQDTSIIASEDDNNAEVRPACNSSASDTGYDEGMDNSSYDSIGTASFSVSGNIEPAVSHMDTSDSEEDIPTYLSARQQHKYWNKGGQSDIMSTNTETLDDIYGGALVDTISHMGEVDDYQQDGADVTMSAAPQAQVSGEYSITSVEGLATRRTSEEDLSQNHRINADLPLEVTMDPPRVPLQGGGLHSFDFNSMLPLRVQSGFATYGDLATGVLERLNDSLIGRWIPPKKEPGWVLVKLYSQSNEYLGEARLFYFNEEKEWVKKVAQDENLLRDLFSTLATSYGTNAENSSSETLNSGNLEGKHSGSTRALQVLQLLVYAAAECGAQQCIKIILNSSAGREVFDAYKDSSPLPEVIARKHGHEEIAHYLEDITTRFGSEKTIFPEGSQTIDWAELVAAAEAAQEHRKLSIASKEEDHQVESDETSDTDYFGDTEATSKESSQLSRSGSEDDDSEISFEEKKVETHGCLNEGCNAQKENVTKRQTSHLIFHRPVTSLSGCLSMSFINEGVFSSKQLNDKGRRNTNNPTLEEKCFFRKIEHFYREVHDLQQMKSVYHPSISFLLSIATERIPHHLSTMYERWRIQLQFNRDSGENIAHQLSLLFHKMDLDSADGRLAISWTQPAVVGESNFVQDLEQLYVDDGLSTPNDEDLPIKGKALDYPTKHRYTTSDAWVLTGIYRPTRMILFVYVADRSDALPPELWFKDEDCEFFTEWWKWQRCRNNSLKFIEKLKGMQERPEIESEQENESLLTLSSGQENGDSDDAGLEIEIDIPPVFLENDANSLGGCELVLREYQKELAEPAVQGKNTIICAPTNSGKTYVAIEIVKRHLDSFSSGEEKSAKPAANSTNRNEGRVVFIVSTVNLVLQQKERFEAFLGHKYTVGEISGANSTDIPLKYLLQSHSVVVMTAQILVNALKNENKEERVELKDISLLLFDECHHAHKEHPYNSIMEKYIALKFQPGYRHSLPQIIGLTASLGTGKAQNVEKAEEHIILVSANLDAEVISTVQKNKAELEKFVNVPKQEVHHVQKNDQNPFEKIIFKVMAQIEAQLKKIKGKSYKAGPPDKGGQQYRQWVEEFYKDSVASGDRYLVTYAEHLREYYVALTLNTNTRMKNARRYLQKYFDSLDREKFTEIDVRLEKLFHKAMQALDKFVEENGGEPENSQLTKLKELILKNYKELQQSNKDQPNKPENGGESKGGNEGDGRRKYSTSDNSPEKADNKEDNTSDDIEASKLADDKDTENTQEKDDKKEEKLAQEETSEKEDRNPPEDASNDDDSVAEANGEKGSEAMDDRKEDSDSSSTETTQEDESDERNAQYHPEWEGPKGILFTRTRDSTEALLDWIKETEELNAVLRPELLVGSGDGNIGMTQNEQERVIKRFKTGEKNILLATSVAEEGLDISDCNYVIRYDMMGNEISLVQSRGRVRADMGKYSVLVGQSGALKREHTSKFRENLMTKALTKVQSMNSEKFKLAVKGVQKTSYQDRYIKKQNYAVKKSVYLPENVTFHCRKCTKVVCRAHDVRRIKGSHHVIINSDVRETKVDVKKHPNPKIIDNIEMNKKIFCKKCGEDWGVIALISNVEWLCIKICSFVLEFPDGDTPRRMYKKWKDLPFGIEEASMEEILDHGFDKGPVDNLLDVDFDH